MMHIRQKYRIYPTKSQQSIINQWIGCGRKVWNVFLADNKTKYEQEKKINFYNAMSASLAKLKKTEEYSYLKDCPSQALQQKLQDLDRTYSSAIKKSTGFPNFKSKGIDTSGIRFPQGWDLADGKLSLPKMKSPIKVIMHREMKGIPTSLTLSRDRAGDYWISIVVQTECQPPVEEIKHVIGIDVGLKEFAVTSDGEVIKNEKFYRKNEKKLAKLARSHSKKKKGSNNKEKARIKLAREHRKIANKRDDFSKQVASSIAKNNDLICVEDLNVKGMMKNHKLAKSIADVGWSQFVNQLEWQCQKRGKQFVKIDRFFPSSKTCSCCGNKQDMPLKQREYNCPCGNIMDRDMNAAINIMKEGIVVYTAGTAEINACRETNELVNHSAQEIMSP